MIEMSVCSCQVDTAGNHRPDCSLHRHQFEVVHHYGDHEIHFCPTGFKMCDCGRIVKTRKDECTLWDGMRGWRI